MDGPTEPGAAIDIDARRPATARDGALEPWWNGLTGTSADEFRQPCDADAQFGVADESGPPVFEQKQRPSRSTAQQLDALEDIHTAIRTAAVHDAQFPVACAAQQPFADHPIGSDEKQQRPHGDAQFRIIEPQQWLGPALIGIPRLLVLRARLR